MGVGGCYREAFHSLRETPQVLGQTTENTTPVCRKTQHGKQANTRPANSRYYTCVPENEAHPQTVR